MSTLWWLQRLPDDFTATPEMEELINQSARLARTDVVIRNALYTALAYRIRGLARTACYRAARLAVCEPDDVLQESFLIYCDLLQSWDGERSFLGYLYTRMPWRLARGIDVLERGTGLTWVVERETDAVPDRYLPEQDAIFLSEISAGLPIGDRRLLQLHIGYGLPLTEIARLRGTNLRTLHRRWARLRTTLAESLADRAAG